MWFGSPHSPHVGVERDLTLYQNQPKKQRNSLAASKSDRVLRMKGELEPWLRSVVASLNGADCEAK